MNRQLTKQEIKAILHFYEKCRKIFRNTETNEFGKSLGKFPGMCFVLDEYVNGIKLTAKLYAMLSADIYAAVGRVRVHREYLLIGYFPTNKQRMQFIRNQVKRYKKMLLTS